VERKADRLAGRAVPMGYHLILFSPATHEAFTASERRLVGVRARQQKAAARVEVGDKLLGYLTELSRWVGVLEVTGAMLRDSTPLFVAENDPYDVRLPVRTEVWLAPERGIPIKDAEIWGRLELVREYDPGQPTWTGKVRTSLVALPEADGRFLEERLRRQAGDGRVEYPLSEGERRKARTQHVQRPQGPVAVEVPEEAASAGGRRSIQLNDDGTSSVPGMQEFRERNLRGEVYQDEIELGFVGRRDLAPHRAPWLRRNRSCFQGLALDPSNPRLRSNS
jgi:hypothetical protein